MLDTQTHAVIADVSRGWNINVLNGKKGLFFGYWRLWFSLQRHTKHYQYKINQVEHVVINQYLVWWYEVIPPCLSCTTSGSIARQASLCYLSWLLLSFLLLF